MIGFFDGLLDSNFQDRRQERDDCSSFSLPLLLFTSLESLFVMLLFVVRSRNRESSFWNDVLDRRIEKAVKAFKGLSVAEVDLLIPLFPSLQVTNLNLT